MVVQCTYVLDGIEYETSFNSMDEFYKFKYFNSVTKLNCINNQISRLDNLPNSLETLNCWNNQISILDNLPNLLKTLNCFNNQITSLDNLPNSLIMVDCSNNPLPNYYKDERNINVLRQKIKDYNACKKDHFLSKINY